MSKKGPLLRLVHSLDRRRSSPTYSVNATLLRENRDGSEVALGAFHCEETRPRAFVVGAGDRVDIAAPGGLLPRHVAVVATPTPVGVFVRILSLHPERKLIVLDDARTGTGPVGGVAAIGRVRVAFEGYVLDVEASAHTPSLVEVFPGVSSVLPLGEQIAFYNGFAVRQVGDVVSSISGPSAGGFAIPALVADCGRASVGTGQLTLRTRDGVHELSPSTDDLRRGVLIGRSRRCVLGRGFDENDGLSRVHALVMLLEGGVYAFDLASRYGLRDVSRPGRLVQSARLDDGAGCLVYGAGHLVYEA